MTIGFRRNPLERDEQGEIFDFERTWRCFTMTVKQAPDVRAAGDAFEFVEGYLNYVANAPCAFLGCAKSEKGVHSDILTFERNKGKKKCAQAAELKAAMQQANAACRKAVATAIPPYIRAATRDAAREESTFR